jgi:hypothetical protein
VLKIRERSQPQRMSEVGTETFILVGKVVTGDQGVK